MQLECNGQVCESYREREQASSSGVRRDDLGVFARVFGIAAPASGSVLDVCAVSWSSSYVFVYYSAYRPEIGRTNKLHRTCTPTARRRGRAGVENESAEVSATRSTCRAGEVWSERFRLTRDVSEVDDARSRDIFHLHTTKPNTLSSGSADPRHQRLRRAASL